MNLTELELFRYGLSAYTRRFFVYSDEWVEDLLAGVAQDLGLELVRSPIFRTWARGTVGAARVELEVWTLANQTLRFRARVIGKGDAGFRSRGVLEQATTATGDPLFDGHVAITGTRRRWFRDRTRSAVQRASSAGAAMLAGTATLDTGGAEFVGPGDVGAAVQTLVDAQRRLLTDDATAEVLAVEDSDAVVRLHALREVLPTAARDWIRARMADPDPRVSLAAAEALGDEGVVRVRELLASSAALDAVRALAPRVEPGKDPDVDAALVRLLGQPDGPIGEVVSLAGKLGGVAVVAPLLRVGGERRAAARDAVKAIQARAMGDRGGVSIAEIQPTSGDLSPAAEVPLQGAVSDGGATPAPGRAAPPGP